MGFVQLQWVSLINEVDQGEMTASLPVNIGRSPGNDLVLTDKVVSVSRRHARVIREEDSLVLIDQDSTNGTYIGERQITRATINSGAEFTVGAYQITLTLQVQCSNEACQRFAAADVRLCPWCGRFMADAVTREALYE
jgi:pSer/pThr/pTyr-binding forkhead associated (FHA) protein